MNLLLPAFSGSINLDDAPLADVSLWRPKPAWTALECVEPPTGDNYQMWVFAPDEQREQPPIGSVAFPGRGKFGLGVARQKSLACCLLAMQTSNFAGVCHAGQAPGGRVA